MNLNLKNKRVIISGATRGIGFEIANQFLEEGAKVVILSRSKEKLEDIKYGDEDLYFTGKTLNTLESLEEEVTPVLNNFSILPEDELKIKNSLTKIKVTTTKNPNEFNIKKKL